MDRERSTRRRVEEDDPRDSRRGREDDRGSRDRGREEPDRSAHRGRDDNDRGSPRRSSREDDDRGSSRRGGSGFRYQPHSAEELQQRASSDSKFDKILKGHIKMWKPNDGGNRVRILPATWKDAKHWGLDIKVHYGVGADRQTYLCLHTMKGEPDPIHEEYQSFVREADPDNKDDAKYLKDLKGTDRVLVYLVDRDAPKEGVQAWAMPSGLDRDLVKLTTDKGTGEVLNVDDPENGYDVTFEKNGKGVNTKYEAVAIARRSTPLGNDDWLDYAVENPLPDQLVYFDYDYIKRMFGGGGGAKGSADRDRDSGRDRDRDDKPSRDRDDEPRRGRERDDDRASSRKEPELTWESIHEMAGKELDALVESDDRLSKVDPKEAKDDEDLADWICEELELKKSERRRTSDDRGRGKDEPDLDDRLAKMRERVRD